jgi:hypothetical protein
MLLAFIGGLVDLIGGLLRVFIFFGSIGLLGMMDPATLIGAVMGIIIILFALLMYFMPKNKLIFGILLIVLAVVNMLIGWDIALLGFALTVIGGIVGGFLGK